MKNTPYLIYTLLFVLIIFVSCSKPADNERTLILETSVKNVSATIPVIHYLRYQPEVEGKLYFNLDSIVKASQSTSTPINQPTSIKVKQITLRLLNPDSANNFSNIEYCFLSLSPSLNTQAIMLAELNLPETASSSVVMQGKGTELIEYLKNEELKLSLGGKARNSTNKELKLEMDFTFLIEQK